MSGVDFVFHAAALKQVPSCEFYPMEALLTNSVGTENVMNAAVAAGVKSVVVLSTDKAAYPINAMGISKAMMEKLAVAKSRVAADRGCTICITRYGNVMASRGSVIPLFVDQIKAGQPLTVTDPQHDPLHDEHRRRRGPGALRLPARPARRLFVQKAPAATIETLALALRQVFDADNPIQIIGTRHGEKQYETLLTREEMLRAVDLGDYYRIPADNRDLNYDAYFTEGIEPLSQQEDYNSHNTRRLSETRWRRCCAGWSTSENKVGDQGSEIGEPRCINALVTGSSGFT